MKEAPEQPDCGGGTSIECHRDADLVRWIARVLEKMGGTTLLGEARDNLCRRASPEEMAEFEGRAWVVESQGLPNLVHEIVHALFLGHLDDDHGFDYGQIPLDIERPDHRALLWEELACCALSTTTCAPLRPDPHAFSLAWFTEQFEIQGVFHGLEHDLDGFRAHVARQLADPRRVTEFEHTVARGHALLAAALADVGAKLSLPHCDAMALWQDYCAATKPGEHSWGRSQVK